jgi:hypothetical protein
MKTNVTLDTEKKFKIQQLKVFILLFFLLGLTWVFGLLGLTIPSLEEWKLSFASAFCVSATMQGFVLFVFFILCDKKITKLWMSLFYDVLRIQREPTSKPVQSTTSTNVKGNISVSETASTSQPEVDDIQIEMKPMNKPE